MPKNSSHQPRLISEPGTEYQITPEEQASKDAYRQRLQEYLQDSEFRKMPGFPIGNDETILELSDSPYYTACPNPFLTEIIEGWHNERIEIRGELGLPDDSSTDGEVYHREPFAADVSEGKNNPIYNAHSYHTKVPHPAIMRYILHYTDPGDIVFDGFCGTGMTGVAAQLCGDRNEVENLGLLVDEDGWIYEKLGDKRPVSKLGSRKTILSDLSPAATFITSNFTSPVDVAAFENESQRILEEVATECGWMYETWHPHCDNANRVKAKINYTIWSDVFICPSCSAEIIFWDVAVDKKNGKVKKEFACPDCKSMQTKRSLERAQESVDNSLKKQVVKAARQKPVLINYSVGNKRFEKLLDDHDLSVIDTIQSNNLPYWYPTTRIDRDIDIWYERDYRSLGIYSVDAFFSKRNLWVLSCFWKKTDNPKSSRLIHAFRFALTAMIINLSRMNRWRANVSFPYNPLSGTLYVSALQSEANVIVGVSNRLKRLYKVWQTYKFPKTSQCAVTTQSTSIGSILIPNNSVDYIFTDPPFGGNIIYSDLSIVWESWLESFTNTESEAVVHRRKKRNATDINKYREMMVNAFIEMYRILIPGHWITVEFHNTQNSVWNAIQEAMLRAGFIVADVRTLDKQLGSYKQVTAISTAKQDLIITAYKPLEQFENNFQTLAGTADGAWAFTRQHLAQLPIAVRPNGKLEVLSERQAYLIFDRMVAFHIQRGVTVPLSVANFYDGLNERFSKRDGMYFLPEQVAEYDKERLESDSVVLLPLIVSNEKTAIQWLQQHLDADVDGQKKTYQYLQPQFLRQLHKAKHEVLPELSEILEQNFLQDGEGSWYVPDPNKANDLEKIRNKALLREFNQYLETKKQLNQFRTEAIRAGFADAWQRKEYEVIVKISDRLPEDVLQEDPDLLMYFDNASLRVD